MSLSRRSPRQRTVKISEGDIPAGKTITLIVDNYIIHKSREALRLLKANPKFRVIYHPVYSPWVNHVERLWQALHKTVPFSVATVEKGSSLYGYREPIPRRETWAGLSVAVLGTVI